jgi:hypothetical protein
VSIDSPANNEIVVGRHVVVHGTASDDTGIEWIRVWVQSGDCPDWNCGYTIHRPATCTGCSFPTGPGAAIEWTARSYDTAPGWLVIRAEAVDRAGKHTFTENVMYVTVDGGYLGDLCPDCF